MENTCECTQLCSSELTRSILESVLLGYLGAYVKQAGSVQSSAISNIL
jgi:hypothetical protein